MMRRDPVVVIGAGLGGLSAAIHLAAAGRQVLVLEQNPAVGGKMGEVRHGGYRWDTGPSLITMQDVFVDLFRTAGRRLEDYLDLRPLDPAVRYFFASGQTLETGRDLERVLAQIRQIEPADVDGFQAFLAYAARLYRVTAPVFIYNRPPGLHSLRQAAPLDLLRLDGLRTMSQAINRYVRSPELRQMLGIFATYAGASPYRAPATLNVIAHVELSQGLWYPAGGVYQIARAYQRLAQDLGVEIRTGAAVSAIELNGSQVSGVALADGETLPASAVVANLDAGLVYERLLPGFASGQARLKSWGRRELSCSAYVMLLGVRGQHPELGHHNTFFSADYRREFQEIFELERPPNQPTIYLAITSKATPADAPPDCENWFIQINVPALGQGWDWSTQAQAYGDRVLELLAQRGLDVREQVEYRRDLTPLDLERLTGARRGALYGFSSNDRWAAFRRPGNRAPGLRGLYFAGGSAHPGGGVPMVTLSGRTAASLLMEDGF